MKLGGGGGGGGGGGVRGGGGGGGRFSAYMVGRRRALDTHMKHFLPPKTRFFDFDVCLSMKRRRPPIRPPPMNSFSKYQNMICDHQSE